MQTSALSCVLVSYGGASGRTLHVAKRRPCWRRSTERSPECLVPAAQAQRGHMPAVRQAPTGLGSGMALVAGFAMSELAFPASSFAHVETAPAGFLQLLLEFIEGLGPLGPAAYTALVTGCELIPLFPTQPLSLASGLLFGAQQGAACMCMGTTLASAIAFTVARGVGKPLAERVIQHELEEAGVAPGGPLQSMDEKLHTIHEAIEHGDFWKQAGAIFLLRLTPVVPFSASNYLLGLTPLPLPPYLVGTAAGMAIWSIVYASLGGASRSLLAKGVNADTLLADLLEKAGEWTAEAATVGVLVAVVVGGVLGAETIRKSLAKASSQTGLARTLIPPTKERQLVEQMED